MQCHELEQYLEQRLGEPLSPEAKAHLSACAACRILVSDLEAIRAVAGELEAEFEPAERVWISLRGQLEAEGLIRPQRQGSWLAGWFAVPRPALAGAYFALLLTAAVVLGLRGYRVTQEATSTDASAATSELRAQLTTVERRTASAIHQHDPAVAKSVQENLGIVDNFIALCEKSVRDNPQNEMAREYLYGAYQQKAELLAILSDREVMAE